MTISYRFGDVDGHGATIRARAGSLETEHQAIVRDLPPAANRRQHMAGTDSVVGSSWA